MAKPEHLLLDIRTGKDSSKTAEAMMEFFSTLPQEKFWQRLARRQEKLSFEIVLDQQLINFYIYLPVRLKEYIKSLILANYPESLVMEVSLDEDPLKLFSPENLSSAEKDQKYFLSSAQIENKFTNSLPLKDYREFKDESESLSAFLSVLSKAPASTRATMQLVLDLSAGGTEILPETSTKTTTNASGETTTSETKSATSPKIGQKVWWVTWRMAVSSLDETLSQSLLENMFHALNTLAKPDGNQLQITKTWQLRNKEFEKNLIQRKTNKINHRSLLSVYELASLYHLPNKSLSTIPNIAWGKNLLGEPPANLPIIKKDYPEEQKQNINVFAQATFRNEFVRYGISRQDRRRHMYVIGKTGTGKSTLLANMAINDLRHNEGFCFIDPHGDAIETLLDYIPSHRINDVVYFNPADGERTVKINLFEGKNLVHRELIASGIVSIFQKLYSYSWGPRLEHFLRNALLTLLQAEEAKMSDIIDLFTNKEFRKKIVAELQDPILKNFWESEFEPLVDRQRQEAIAPILNKVGQFVSSPLVRNVVNSHKSSFSIEDIMDQGKILLVNLSQGRLGEDNATLLGAMLITKIQLAAMSRVNTPEEERRDFYLYVDEFQNFATESFNKILSEARKYRLSLILANQYIAQIPEDVRKAIFGNCGTMISFVLGSEDAKIFSDEYSNKYTPDDLVSLNRHQIINRLAIDNVISQPFPAWTLPLAKNTNSNREKVIRVSRERYAGKN